MQSRNVSITATEILENNIENVENISLGPTLSFPGNPHRIGGTHQDLAASTQRLYLTNQQIFQDSCDDSLSKVRTINNTDEDVVSILNAARPRILDVDCLRTDLRSVENETNVEAAIEYDQRY